MGDDDLKPPPTAEEMRKIMKISSLSAEIVTSSEEVARFLLEAHQWDDNAAASAFNNALRTAAAAGDWRSVPDPRDPRPRTLPRVHIPVSSQIRVRSPRSPRAERNPFSREAIQEAERDLDERQQQGLAKESDDGVERALPSSSRRRIFTSLSELLSATPQVATQIVTIWRNGFTLDNDTTFWSFDDPQNTQFLQELESVESPRVCDSPGGKRRVTVKLIRRQEEDFPLQESPKPFQPFQGVARTLASDEPPASSSTQPTPSVDPTVPTTSIQLILADGARIVSRFNTHHTIRDVRDFIDAARPDGSRDYQLLNMMDFPPEPLTDLDQTIDQAGISNSALTQKF